MLIVIDRLLLQCSRLALQRLCENLNPQTQHSALLSYPSTYSATDPDVGLTLFTTLFSLEPQLTSLTALFIAPLSELYGRNPNLLRLQCLVRRFQCRLCCCTELCIAYRFSPARRNCWFSRHNSGKRVYCGHV